jgi:hypothetical protein
MKLLLTVLGLLIGLNIELGHTAAIPIINHFAGLGADETAGGLVLANRNTFAKICVEPFVWIPADKHAIARACDARGRLIAGRTRRSGG